ncbi:MAG TPA: hypothetical protein VLG28_01785 [Acidimicrobiia bacterium]|jgi:hypothetical protein|nr:hypothetical protein [Acidimicrobiia bacterium]
MKRLMVMLLALTVALTLGAFPVLASAEPNASGTWDYTLTAPPEIEVAGPNVFFYGQDRGEWGGTFEGYSQEEFVLVCHPTAGFSFYKGEMTFYGTVFDEAGAPHEGTMVLKTNGKQYSDACEPSSALWEGHWVIISGTEGLANVHGHGTFDGPSFHLRYAGYIDFSS